MRFRRIAILALGLMAAAGGARAAQDDPRLDDLFATLKSGDDAAADAATAEIWTIWNETGDPDSSTLLRHATLAMSVHSFDVAKRELDALVARQPNFAEAWNKRATLAFMSGDYALSVSDIEHALALEPRHFGALSGLGLIYMSLDRPEGAIRSFEAALAINPHMPGVAAHLAELRKETEGSGI